MRVMAQQRRSGQTSLGRCHPSRDWREPAMWGSGRGTAGAKALRWEWLGISERQGDSWRAGADGAEGRVGGRR